MVRLFLELERMSFLEGQGQGCFLIENPQEESPIHLWDISWAT